MIRLFFASVLFLSSLFAFSLDSPQEKVVFHFHKKPKLEIKKRNYDGDKFVNKSFKGYEFRDVVFKNVTFDRVDFTSTRFTNTKFYKCKFKEVDFRNSMIVSSIFRSCEINYSFFESLGIYNSLFLSSKFLSSSFRGSRLQNTRFTKTILTGTIWTNGKQCKKGSIGKCKLAKKKKFILKF